MAPPTVKDDVSSGAEAAAARYSCQAWWKDIRWLFAATFPCHAALGLSAPAPPPADGAVVRGTLFLPSTGSDRRVRLFIQERGLDAAASEAEHLAVLDLPAGLGGADIAAAGRIVLEYQRQWAPDAGAGALLDSPKWLVYCNGRRVGFAARRDSPSDAEGWVLDKLRAVTASAGRLPGGGLEYLRGRFERIVGSSDAESFHLVEPAGWPGVNGGDGLSIFFHRI